MAKINRITGNVDAFAKDALGTERTVFGGVTQSDDLNDQINDEFKRGWGIVGPSEFPKIQDFNAVGFTTSMMSAYLYQMGIAEWHGAQQYQIRSVVSAPDGIYICKTANHTSATSPKDDPSNWDALVAQSLGTDTSVTVSQKVITDGLNARLPRTDVVGVTGTSTTAVMSQKATTDRIDFMFTSLQLYTDFNFINNERVKQVTGASESDLMSQKAISDQLLGVGQTWQDLTASRASGVTYTNTTGRTIQLSILSRTSATGSSSMSFVVDEVVIYSDATSSHVGTYGIFVNVPPGATYRLIHGSNMILRTWGELR